MKRIFVPLLLVFLAVSCARGRWETPILPSFSSGPPDIDYAPTAKVLVRDLDAQIVSRFGIIGNRSSYYVAVTVPADLGNLEATSSVGRLMAEEMSAALTVLGYNVQEMRKGKDIVFDKRQGEFILTRKTTWLAKKNVLATLIVAGTYAWAPDGLRLSIECLDARNNDVVAKSSRTLAMLPGDQRYFGDISAGQGLTPTVTTTTDCYACGIKLR